jgi:transcriptional regulator of NAD metabolism
MRTLALLSRFMDPQRIQAAIARIEAAAERIASTARQPAPDPAIVQADEELARRHRKLREEAASALADLDQLILELEQ